MSVSPSSTLRPCSGSPNHRDTTLAEVSPIDVPETETASSLPEAAPPDLPEVAPSALPEVPISTLPQVDPRQDSPPEAAYSTLPEVVAYNPDHDKIPAAFGAESGDQSPEVTPASPKDADESVTPTAKDTKPWWRRHWLWLLLGTILIAAAAIGGGVGGGLAASGSSDSSSSDDDSPSADSSTTTSEATATPTASSDTGGPYGSIYIASLLNEGELVNRVAFRETDAGTACESAVAFAEPSEIPCEQPFELGDGYVYRWRGCGSDPSFLTWEGDDGEEMRFGACEEISEDAQWECEDGIIEGDLLCTRRLVERFW